MKIFSFVWSPHIKFMEPYSGIFKTYSDFLKPYSDVFLQIFFFLSMIALISSSRSPIVMF